MLGQLIIPQTKTVKKYREPRKDSEPRVKNYRPLKKFEILHRPFDLKFRGRIYRWLLNLQKKDLNLIRVLGPKKYLYVKYYFQPQKKGKKWLNQKEALYKINNKQKGRMRDALIKILQEVWLQTKND